MFNSDEELEEPEEDLPEPQTRKEKEMPREEYQLYILQKRNRAKLEEEKLEARRQQKQMREGENAPVPGNKQTGRPSPPGSA